MENWRLKVFCPAFLQKSGRGPGAEPWPRAAARGTLLVLTKRRRGSKGEPSPGVPPLRAAPPPAARATPRGRQWMKERVVEDADPYGGRETDRVPPDLLRDHPTPGPGRAERGEAGKNRDGGTSRTPFPTGLARVFTLEGMSCTVLVYGVAKGRGPIPARTSDGLAAYHVAHGPFPTRRRGRRPRRPFPSSTADLTAFLQPLVGAGFHPRPASDDCGRL